MSIDLYRTRLIWQGRSGLVRYAGVTQRISAWPADFVLGVEIAEVDYCPDLGPQACLIREHTGGWREMTRAEANATHAWLVRMASASDTTGG